MHERPFPKPQPAAPLPLESWLRRADRAEAGREPFFRGRDAEFEVFRSALESLEEGIVGGGTMVFQGAPGAGKSALMQECMEAVRQYSAPETPWVAVDMPFENLDSAPAVISAIHRAVRTESERLRAASPDRFQAFRRSLAQQGGDLLDALMKRGAGAFGITVGGLPETGKVASGVFLQAAPLLEKFHIVVCVDEAQNIPVGSRVQGVMNCLHGNPQGIPLVAAFFGLSDTGDRLRQCGLSRFADERLVDLEPLSVDEAADAIRSAFETYGFAGTAADKAQWVEQLAALTQGWPQHVNRAAVAAARVLRENGGRIEARLLPQALADGKARKDAYYAGRLDAGILEPRIYKQIALAAGDAQDGALSRSELRSLATPELESAAIAFDDFLTNALHAGLLAPSRRLPHHYRIPIPSLGDYLRALAVEPAPPGERRG